ncbi:MAG TPA: M56 family metallopeptidase, partial [Thermoanaerobaculia bacterium]|nr:M56 family metallopeptidase [Thermoanaerobaculia bacterium]
MMLELETFAHHWYAMARGMTLQAAFLIAIAALIALAARKAAPQARHLLWLVVLARLAIPLPLTSPLGLLSLAPAHGIARTLPAVSRAVQGQRVSTAPAASSTPFASRATATPEGYRFDLATALFLGWLGTILFLVFIVAVRAWRTRRRLAAAALPPPPELEKQLATLYARLRLSRPPSLLTVADPRLLSSPAVTGLWRPTILLPSDIAEDWTAEDLEAILLHELVHLERRDHWVNALQSLVQLVFFFHPFVWWANRELRKERELAVDDRVVEFLDGQPRGYAEALLRFAERPRRQRRLAGALRMAESRASLPRRLQRLAIGRIATRRQRILASLCLLLLASGSLAFAARPARHATQGTTGKLSIQISHHGAILVAPDPSNPKRLQWKTWKREFKTGKLLDQPAAPFEKIPAGFGPKLLLTGLVGPDGRVLEAAVITPVDPELEARLLAYVKAFRFSPTLGKDGTALASRLAVILSSPPLSGQETSPKNPVAVTFVFPKALIPPAQTKPISEWKTAPLSGDIKPPKLAHKGRLSLRSLPSGFGPEVTAAALIDAEGRIVSPSIVTPLPGAFALPILAFIRSLRFAPARTIGGQPVGAELRVVLDYGASGAGRGEEAEVKVPNDWKAEMNRLYHLAPGQNLKIVAPPFSPARLGYYRETDPIQSLYIPTGPTQMVITWAPSGVTTAHPYMLFGGPPTLQKLLGGLGIPGYRLEGPEDLLSTVLRGDVVVRKGSGEEARITDLAKALAKRGTSARFTWASETRPTIVARGTLGNPPIEGKEPLPTLHVYTDHKNPDPNAGAGGTGTVHDCLRWMAAHLG